MKMVFILFKHFLFPIICHWKFNSSIVYILSKCSFFTIKIRFDHFQFSSTFHLSKDFQRLLLLFLLGK